MDVLLTYGIRFRDYIGFFPQNYGYCIGGPHRKGFSTVVSILGLPYFGEPTIGFRGLRLGLFQIRENHTKAHLEHEVKTQGLDG